MLIQVRLAVEKRSLFGDNNNGNKFEHFGSINLLLLHCIACVRLILAILLALPALVDACRAEA
jgi:hypothetical protein